MLKKYSIYQCSNLSCQFRFPTISEYEIPRWCPKCKSNLIKSLSYIEESADLQMEQANQLPIKLGLLLDNIRSAYNVGSILRSAEGFKIAHVYLCGITATPDNPKIGKTSLGAEQGDFWSYSSNSLLKAGELKQEGKLLIGLESCRGSKSIFEIKSHHLKKQTILVVGNELAGIDPEVRQICDELVFIPMQGKKSSYNVAIAFGIATFYLNYICQK